MTDFIDTNVLVYSISVDPKEIAFAKTARDILKSDDCVLSVQSLNEFFRVVTSGKGKNGIRIAPIDPEKAYAIAKTWLRFEIIDVTLENFHRAVQISTNYNIHFFDASLLASAERAGCDRFLTQDRVIKHGMKIGEMEIFDPFIAI